MCRDAHAHWFEKRPGIVAWRFQPVGSWRKGNVEIASAIRAEVRHLAGAISGLSKQFCFVTFIGALRVARTDNRAGGTEEDMAGDPVELIRTDRDSANASVNQLIGAHRRAPGI